MTAATITPAIAGADLLDELRQLLDRHDDAATLDEVREIADELTSVLRRARRRIGRLARKTAPRKPVVKESLKPAADAGGAAARESNPHSVPLSTAPGRPRRQPSVAAGLPAAVPEPRADRSRLVAALLAVARAVAYVARAVVRRRRPVSPAMPLPRAEDAPPLSAMRRSPLEVAAGLQVRKRQDLSAYQDTVLLWEMGTRAHQGLEIVR